MASIRKRPGTKHPFQVLWHDHKGRKRSKQFTLKKDADAFKLDIERRTQLGHLDTMEAGQQTLEDVVFAFFELHKGEWRHKTRTDHAYVWNCCVLGDPSARSRKDYPRAEIADMQVRAIRRSHIQAFKVDAERAGVPQTSIKRALQLMRSALDYAADDGLIDANPAAGVKPPKPKPRKDIYVVTPEQVEKIRAQMPTERDKVLVSVLAYAGLRPAELRGLDANHVGAKALRVEAAGSYDGKLQALKSKASNRSVPICSALAEDLEAYGVKSGPLFPANDGKRMTKIDFDNWRKRRFEAATKAAKVPMNRPYELRHSIASMWLREGTDRVTVAQWLGHSVEMLERNYAHVMADLDPSDRRTVDEQIADARAA